MQAEGYRRARNLLTSRRDHVVARVLGFAQSLLLVVLLGIIAVFVAVMASRGEARFPTSEVKRLPAWVISRYAGQDGRLSMFRDTGVFPLVAGNLLSDNIVHRFSARALLAITNVLPSLRSNVGALATLLGLGLACVLLIAIVAIWRRTAIAQGCHRSCGDLAQADSPPDVPARPVVASDRGSRARSSTYGLEK